MMYLSLPLPTEKTRWIEISLVGLRAGGALTVRFGISIDKRATIAQLRDAIARVANVKAKNLIVCEVNQHRVFTYFGDQR